MSCNYDILEESKAGIYPLNGYLSLSYRGEVLELGRPQLCRCWALGYSV